MAYSLEENYNTGDTLSTERFGSNLIKAQTFESAGGFTLTRVKVKLWRESGATGNVSCAIYSTSSSLPSALIQAADSTIDLTTITLDNAGAWYTFDFTSGVTISAATEYAIVVDSDGATYGDWRADFSSPTYANGESCYSTNNGSSWTQDASHDYMFETYSGTDTVYEELAAAPSMAFTGVAALDISQGLAAAGTMAFTGTAFLTFGPLSGTKSEKYKSIVVACGNDSMYYEDV